MVKERKGREEKNNKMKSMQKKGKLNKKNRTRSEAKGEKEASITL